MKGWMARWGVQSAPQLVEALHRHKRLVWGRWRGERWLLNL
jgi:hypothetical protein